jgi:hypothetical protein
MRRTEAAATAKATRVVAMRMVVNMAAISTIYLGFLSHYVARRANVVIRVVLILI